MAEYTRPESEEAFDRNFAQKKPRMNETEAHYESSRCLFCFDAPCVEACPTHIDIPLFIRQIQTGNKESAATTIFSANWLGNACGKVCPTGVLCEGACVFNLQQIKPIEIGRLQHFATSAAMDSGMKMFAPGVTNGKKVAVVGAGPAGIACACELRVLGFDVDIFEAKDKPTGLLLHGIAPYKIKNEEVMQELQFLQQQLGFTIHFNRPILTESDFQELENKYDAIFIGVGLGATASLNLAGEGKKNVVGAVEFIEELRMNHHALRIPEKVVVIGGGNTAMDAASAAARLGAKSVTLAYRKGKEEMGAYGFEYQLAVSAGVDALFNAQPEAITGESAANGVKFSQTKTTANGSWEIVPGSDFIIPCDLVILATGQQKQVGIFSLIQGLQWTKDKRLVVHPETYQTSNPKYFAGGDAVNGGAEVVNAAFDGKQAARGILNWLSQ